LPTSIDTRPPTRSHSSMRHGRLESGTGDSNWISTKAGDRVDRGEILSESEHRRLRR